MGFDELLMILDEAEENAKVEILERTDDGRTTTDKWMMMEAVQIYKDKILKRIEEAL